MDRIAFLHVQKTGGSSLAAALCKKFASWEIFPWHFGKLDQFNPADLTPFRLFHGHFGIADLDFIPKPTKTITLLREPCRRIHSLYNFFKSYKSDIFPKYEPFPPRIAKFVGLKTFLTRSSPSLQSAIDNALVGSYLPYSLRGRNGELTASPDTMVDDALQALDEMTAFGILERVGDSMRAISAELNTPLILPVEKVRSFDTLGANQIHEAFEREDVTPEIDDLLKSHTEVDRLFYDRAVKVFETKFGHHFRTPAAGQGAAFDRGLSGLKLTRHWGDWINFGVDFHLDGVSMTGWSAQEVWGIWSVSHHAALKIGPLPKPGGPIRLTMVVRPSVFEKHPHQVIDVILNGRQIETWEFSFDAKSGNSIKILNLPSSAVDEGGFLNLTFHVERLVNLLAEGISADDRELGLGLENIHLECFA
jgi:hypothetical protein